jgi:hypothetical protein
MEITPKRGNTSENTESTGGINVRESEESVERKEKALKEKRTR